MNKSQTYAIGGALLGGLAAAVSASPLTGADVILGAAIMGAIGYAIGRRSDLKSGKQSEDSIFNIAGDPATELCIIGIRSTDNLKKVIGTANVTRFFDLANSHDSLQII